MSADLARVRALLEMGRAQEALRTLDMATAEAADATAALCLRSQALLALRRPSEAATSARRAAAAAPDDEWPHRLLALAQQDLGKHRSALGAAQEAARLAPLSLHAQHVLAVAQLNAGNSAAAEVTALRCAELAPDTLLAHQTVAVVAMGTGKLDVAEDAARRALAIAPNDDATQAQLAQVLEQRGRADEALRLRIAALQANPHEREHRRSLLRTAAPADIAVGTITKIGAAHGLLTLIRVARLHYPWSSLRAHLLSVGVLHAVAVVIWLVFAGRRRRRGRDLPPGFYTGLRPERRLADLHWVRGVGVLMSVLTVAGLFAWSWGSVQGSIVSADAGLAAGELGLAVVASRRVGARYAVEREPSVVAVLLRNLIDRMPHPGRGMGTTHPLQGFYRDGEPDLRERLARVRWHLFGACVAGVIAYLAWPPLGLVALFGVAALAEIGSNRRPRPLPADASYRPGHRIVVNLAGTPATVGQLAVRSWLRLVLAVPLCVQYLRSPHDPRRCLHDRLTDTTVVRLRTAFDQVSVRGT